MPQTLIVAGIAALAILLIAVGIASSGGSGMSDRLERYASGQKPDKKAKSTGQGPISDLIAQSEALANFNKVVEGRDFGANLSREIARADLKLKPTEFIFIWIGADHRHPGLHVHLLVRPAGARQPAVPAHRRTHRVLASALLAEPPEGRPIECVQQATA